MGSGRVGGGGGSSGHRYISKKEREKKCNGFESAVVSRPAAGSEREKEIEIDWEWGWRRRAKIRCAGPVLLLRGSPRSQFSKQTVCLCASYDGGGCGDGAKFGPDALPPPQPAILGVPLATHRQHEDEDEDEEEHSMSSARRSLTKLGNGAMCVFGFDRVCARRETGPRSSERPDRHGRSPSRPSRDGLARFASPQPAGITARWGFEE